MLLLWVLKSFILFQLLFLFSYFNQGILVYVSFVFSKAFSLLVFLIFSGFDFPFITDILSYTLSFVFSKAFSLLKFILFPVVNPFLDFIADILFYVRSFPGVVSSIILSAVPRLETVLRVVELLVLISVAGVFLFATHPEIFDKFRRFLASPNNEAIAQGAKITSVASCLRASLELGMIALFPIGSLLDPLLGSANEDEATPPPPPPPPHTVEVNPPTPQTGHDAATDATNPQVRRLPDIPVDQDVRDEPATQYNRPLYQLVVVEAAPHPDQTGARGIRGHNEPPPYEDEAPPPFTNVA